ncbi:MAG: hypothetical protein G01um101420_777 [Parcubacteria group bacterium Gr01-1014_20]|nr:MAG: hypothetical protein G01um101420_777 [Parcubacteria group bacterium Gr01-1014_20]
MVTTNGPNSTDPFFSVAVSGEFSVANTCEPPSLWVLLHLESVFRISAHILAYI